MNIYIVDDDSAIGSSLGFMLATLKLDCQTFSSGEDFLDHLPHLSSGCVIMDLNLGGMDGLAVHAQMKKSGCDWPVVFLTGQCSVPVVVQAMKQGAIEFMVKPSSEEGILEALHKAAVELSASSAPRLH